MSAQLSPAQPSCQKDNNFTRVAAETSIGSRPDQQNHGRCDCESVSGCHEFQSLGFVGGDKRENEKGVEGNLCQQGVYRRLVAEGRRKQRRERVNSGFVFMCV